MTRHQALELLITRRIPGEVAAIEATLRAIAGRIDAAADDEEYDEVHHRLDELLTPASAPGSPCARSVVWSDADRDPGWNAE